MQISPVLEKIWIYPVLYLLQQCQQQLICHDSSTEQQNHWKRKLGLQQALARIQDFKCLDAWSNSKIGFKITKEWISFGKVQKGWLCNYFIICTLFKDTFSQKIFFCFCFPWNTCIIRSKLYYLILLKYLLWSYDSKKN